MKKTSKRETRERPKATTQKRRELPTSFCCHAHIIHRCTKGGREVKLREVDEVEGEASESTARARREHGESKERKRDGGEERETDRQRERDKDQQRTARRQIE